MVQRSVSAKNPYSRLRWPPDERQKDYEYVQLDPMHTDKREFITYLQDHDETLLVAPFRSTGPLVQIQSPLWFSITSARDISAPKDQEYVEDRGNILRWPICRVITGISDCWNTVWRQALVLFTSGNFPPRAT